MQEANDARLELADGFEIDEGDRQLTMRFPISKNNNSLRTYQLSIKEL